MDFPLWIESLLNGLIGGVLYILIQKLGWESNYEIIRRLSLGMIAGYISHLLGHLDPVATITAGYFALDVIEAILNNRHIGKDTEKSIGKGTKKQE